MPTFIRYLYTHRTPAGTPSIAPLTLASIGRALADADPDFRIVRDLPEDDPDETGQLLHGDDDFGVISVNLRGDPLCDDDLDEFREGLRAQDDPRRVEVLDVIARAAGMVALRLSNEGFAGSDWLDPLWLWLFAAREGVLQIDDEGFFDADSELIVSLL